MKDFMITSGYRHDKSYLSAKLFSPDATVRQIVAALGVRQAEDPENRTPVIR